MRLRILNGRDNNDITGKVTFCNARGTSLIDNVLVEEAFLQEKNCSFSVGDLNEYSDHLPYTYLSYAENSETQKLRP